MPVTLRDMDVRDLPPYLDRVRAEYVRDLVTAGRSTDDARRHADESLARLFPSGEPAPRHAVFEVVDDAGDAVGRLWIGPDTTDDPDAWWVWDIEIDADRRGRGLGREAMILGEAYARARGARTLGLNVFGFNTGARGLYESLGFETAAVTMLKRLH